MADVELTLRIIGGGRAVEEIQLDAHLEIPRIQGSDGQDRLLDWCSSGLA